MDFFTDLSDDPFNTEELICRNLLLTDLLKVNVCILRAQGALFCKIDHVAASLKILPL